MENCKIKILIFLLLLVSLLIILYYSVFEFSLSYISKEEIIKNREKVDNLIDNLKINDIDIVYDKTTKLYFLSVPYEYKNDKYLLELNLDDGYKYKIVNYKTNKVNIDYEKIYEILIYNDKYYTQIFLQLTNLPIVSIITDTNITINETNSIFKYINVLNLDKIITSNSKIHIRGDTSKRYDKKSYKLEIYDNEYENEKNINIPNFYYGSSFILDATFRDCSKIRNVLSTQLWNDFSDDYENINMYSEFVELFINDEYAGLYVFTEPVNRKKLNLSKNTINDTSVVIKSTNFKYPTLKTEFNNIYDDTYLGYEIKYPNNQEYFDDVWEKYLLKMATYYDNNLHIKYDELETIFNVRNYADLILFNSFTNNYDNKLLKNNYFYMKNLNDVIYIQPWDMEFSYGIIFDYDAKYNFKKLNDVEEIPFDIYHDNNEKINKIIIDRYWQLRKNILTKEYFDSYIEKYKTLLNQGAVKRDSLKWIEYDFETEIDEVRSWIYKRIDVYDNYIRSIESK